MPARLSPFAALHHRNFRIFWMGQTVSLIGTWMQSLAQGWLVLQLTDSAFWVGLVGFAGSLPILLFTLPAGVYVDRADKQRLVMRCQALLALQATLLTVLTATGWVRPWHVALLATAAGLINSIEIPARQSFIIELVGRDDLTNAIALNSSSFNATRILGPAIAGLLVAHVGLAVCFALNAFSYAAVLASLARLRLVTVTHPPAESRALERFREGMRFVRGDRRVRALVLCTAFLSLFGFPVVVLLPVFARDVLRVGADGLGVMSACLGIGAVSAALGLAALAPRVRRGRLVSLAAPSFGLAIIAFAAMRWLPGALACLGFVGFAMVLNNAATNTLLQSLVPDALRGRVMSLWTTVFVGFAPLGALAMGWLAGRTGAPAAAALGGGLAALATGWTLLRAPEVRALR
jgi:MFS family permease